MFVPLPSALALYRTVARIRAFEERVATRFRGGDIHGFVHVSLGQEAVAAGACSVLHREDAITTTHRGHGHCIAKGADPTRMMAELFGRATGICGGKGGSMHIADPSIGILGANGIVGAGIPLAVGSALASRLLDDDCVSVAFLGDGAVHTGAFHEAVTLAVAWDLAVVLVCENNGYAEFTRSDRWGGPGLTVRGAAYGLRTAEVDGNDAVTVAQCLGEIVEATRAGSGPAFVEARTTRFSGHYEGDPQRYRGEEELASLGSRDPLELLRTRIDDRSATDALDAEASTEMDRAVDAALEAPYPKADAALADVYA
jgi:TPP-dependent pyruvate/acetoin dehydrogenase alpha subunit